MSASEWQRLERDLQTQPALRETLVQCRSREEAAAVAQSRGYRVSAIDLPSRQALPDEALDQVTGGVIHNPANRWIPFDW